MFALEIANYQSIGWSSSPQRTHIDSVIFDDRTLSLVSKYDPHSWTVSGPFFRGGSCEVWPGPVAVIQQTSVRLTERAADRVDGCYLLPTR